MVFTVFHFSIQKVQRKLYISCWASENVLTSHGKWKPGNAYGYGYFSYFEVRYISYRNFTRKATSILAFSCQSKKLKSSSMISWHSKQDQLLNWVYKNCRWIHIREKVESSGTKNEGKMQSWYNRIHICQQFSPLFTSETKLQYKLSILQLQNDKTSNQPNQNFNSLCNSCYTYLLSRGNKNRAVSESDGNYFMLSTSEKN